MREQEQDIYVSKLQVIKKKLIPKKKRKKIFTMNWTKGRMDGGGSVKKKSSTAADRGAAAGNSAQSKE